MANAETLIAPDTSALASRFRGSGLLKRRWLYHLLFWLVYFGLTLVLYLGVHVKITWRSCGMYLAILSLMAGLAYLNLYVLIPRLLFARKFVAYACMLCVAASVCSGLMIGLEWFVAKLAGTPEGKMDFVSLSNFSVGFIEEIYVLGMTTGIKFVKDSFLNQQWLKEKEKHYLETELKFLKSQIQPHFFFNTLNNIYSLTLKKSDQAPEVILKLSELMSYMLYESNAPWVPLSKEINYLNNYLAVEQLRFGQRLSINFTQEGTGGETNIPPMILILFIENSFKHGVRNSISKIHIDISLRVADGYLYFRVENPAAEEEAIVENNGIGLRNARRRLELLYGTNYQLDIRDDHKTFIVSLKIPVC
jgi:hypothetical protein